LRVCSNSSATSVTSRRYLQTDAQIPVYKGAAGPTLTASFACTSDETTNFNQTPAQQYGP
jgi:hypothetical protein